MYLSSHTIMDLAKLHSDELIQEADRQRLADRVWRRRRAMNSRATNNHTDPGLGPPGRATNGEPARAGPRRQDSPGWTDLTSLRRAEPTQTYSDVNGAQGRLRTTMNTAQAAMNMAADFAPIRGIGICRPVMCLTAHAR